MCITMHDFCRSQVSPCMTLQESQESSISAYDSGRSQVSVFMIPAGVKYLYVWLLQESSITMYDSCTSKLNISLYDSCRSQVSVCMTPAGVTYFYV